MEGARLILLFPLGTTTLRRETYSIHTRHKGKISRGLILRRQQKAASLRSRHINHLGGSRLMIHAIDFDDGHIVALEPDVLSREGADVDHAEEVRFPGLDGDFEVLRLVEEGRLRHRFCASRVAFVVEGREQDGHLLVVPV